MSQGSDDDASLIVLDGERFVVLAAASPASGGSDAGARLRSHSTTVARKDGTYVSKLTLWSVVDGDAGQYVCLSSNSAGYSLRRAHLAVLARQCRASRQNDSSLTRITGCSHLPTNVGAIFGRHLAKL